MSKIGDHFMSNRGSDVLVEKLLVGGHYDYSSAAIVVDGMPLLPNV